MAENNGGAQLVYQIICDDVRLEVGNKLSLMGLFQEVFVQRLPVVLQKIAVVSQWQGAGRYSCEIRILSPDRAVMIANSPVADFEVPANGYANNVTFFINIQFEREGNYIVQTLLNGRVFTERAIMIGQVDANGQIAGDHIN